jgi:hypothetical protein
MKLLFAESYMATGSPVEGANHVWKCKQGNYKRKHRNEPSEAMLPAVHFYCGKKRNGSAASERVSEAAKKEHGCSHG